MKLYLSLNYNYMNHKIFYLLIITILFSVSGCTLLSQKTTPARITNGPTINEQNINQSSSQDSLYLSGQNLTKIPDYVFKQTNLEELNVSNNNLTGAIQAEIRQLTKLKVLKASNNKMTGVPAEVGQLNNLQVLDLSNNQLTGLPNEIGNLKNLKTFNISGNNYSELDLKTITDRLPNNVNIIK